jgi:hypothetical protein
VIFCAAQNIPGVFLELDLCKKGERDVFCVTLNRRVLKYDARR